MRKLNIGATILVLILITATVVFVFGSGSGSNQPSTTNPKGLGLAAFGELMQSSGIPYQSTRSVTPAVTNKDLLIVVEQENYWLDIAQGYLEDPDEPIDEASEENQKPEEPDPITFTLEKHLKSGGRILNLVLWDYGKDSVPAANPVTIKTIDGKSNFKLRLPENAELDDATPLLPSVPYLKMGKGNFAYLASDRGGTILQVEDGEFIRNRYLAFDQNATFTLWLIRKFLPEGGKVIFLEATAGNAERRGALDEAGKWAPAAFWQLILLVGIIVATLAPRFGLASREFVTTRGAKELMSAMSLVLLRAQRHDHALAILRQSCIERIRQALRLPVGLPENEVISRVHPDFQALISQVAAIQGREVNRHEAVKMANGLIHYIHQLENEEKAKRSFG